MKIVNDGDLVQVSRDSIKSVGQKTLELLSGNSIQVDAIIFATGWQSSSCPLFSPAMRAEIGLPVPLGYLSDEEAGYWRELDKVAEKEVLDLYPYLLHRPKDIITRNIHDTPFRLLRTIIPPKLASQHDRSIAFLSQPINTQNTFFAEISGLWTIAYLEGLLSDNDLIENKDAMDHEIALMLAFMKWRYPGRNNVPIAGLEIRHWMDKMLSDLGVRTDRNRLHWERTHPNEWDWWGWKAWIYEWFLPYEPEVYKGIVQEFLDRVGENNTELKKTK